MSSSRSSSWFRTTATGIISILLLAVVIFFGLTRTEIGRDGLRIQLERQFDAQFEGSLQIERLDGNLVNTLFARNVQVRGPQGQVVVQADSVVLRPTWSALLNRTLTLSAVDVHTVHAVAEHTDHGMPLAQAFARTGTDDDSEPVVDTEREKAPSLNLSMPRIRLHDAHLTTRQTGAAPPAIAEGWLVDLLNTSLHLPRADLDLQWSAAGRYADVRLSGLHHPDTDLTVERFSGRLERTEAGWALAPAELDTDASSLRIEGTLSDGLEGDAPFAISVKADPIDFGEWSAVFPRIPNQEPVTLEAAVRGPLSTLIVETLRVEQGPTTVTLDGTAFGFPHDMDVEGAFQVDTLTREVAESWSHAPLPTNWTAALPLSGEVYARGQIQAAEAVSADASPLAWRPSTATGTVEIDFESAVGGFASTTDLGWGNETPLTYAGSATLDALAVDVLVPDLLPASTELTGTVDVEGEGLSREDALARADIAFTESVLAGGYLERIEGTLTLDRASFGGVASLTQAADQTLAARWVVDPTDTATRIDASLEAEAFDISPWGSPWQDTAFTGEVTTEATATATTLESGTLSLHVDSSAVTPRTVDTPGSPRTIPAHTLTASLEPPTDPRENARLFISGDVLSVTAGGSGWTQPRLRLLPAWAQAVATTIAYEHAAEGFPSELAVVSESAESEAPQWTSPEGVSGSFTLWSEAQIHRADVLHAWMPSAPPVADDAAIYADVYASPDSMHSAVRLTASTLQLNGTTAEALDVEVSLGADHAGPLPERLTVSTRSYADLISTPAASLFEPLVRLSYGNRQGTLSFETEERGQTGPIRMEADVRAFDTRNELIIQHISAEAGSHRWSTTQPSRWNLYANRITGAPLELTSDAPISGETRTQSIILDGTFSPADDDALNIQFDNVQLLPLSQLAGWSQPLGGLVNGDLQIGGTWSTPIGAGDLRVDEWSFDRRLLGDLSLTARYIAGAPDLELDLSLVPTDVETPADARQALVPDGIQQVVENRLDLGGRLRVAEEASDWDEDEWIDLTLNVDRADLFFFDFVFGEVMHDIEGYTSGSSSITGRWGRPVFDANLEVDGSFSIPRFNLAYTLDGPIDVDREGIHLRDALLEDSDDGSARIGGSVLFNDYQFFSFDLESDVDNLTIMDVARADDLPFYGFIRASGPLQLQGPLSNTRLTSNNARTSSDTEVFIPVTEGEGDPTSGFLIYADSTSHLLDWAELTRRANIFADRPAGEASFLDGMEIDLNIEAVRGGRLHIVFDALVGDVITTEGTGRVQLQREDGEFSIFGSLDVIGGTYLFTAGEVFVRRFSINRGTLSWDGDPINAEMDIEAAFRTRASPAGLPGFSDRSARIPVVIDLGITGRVETPEVALGLSLDRDQRDQRVGSQTFDALLNQDDRMTEFATSVLLTNTFLLTTENIAGTGSQPGESSRLADTGGQLAFNSVSQLVSSQLNRYLSEALPNVDINVGVQGETTDDLDIIYGVALRLLDERLIIRGEGVYTGNNELRTQQSGPQGEFAVEVRLSNQVSMEVFYRRTGDDITRGQTLTSTTGVGLFYQTQFSTWGTLWHRIIGRSDAEDALPPTIDPPEVPTDTTTIVIRPERE